MHILYATIEIKAFNIYLHILLDSAPDFVHISFFLIYLRSKTEKNIKFDVFILKKKLA